MISIVILLALASSADVHGAAVEAQAAKEAQVAVIHAGDSVQGVLPLRIESGRNAGSTTFDLDATKVGALTITLESLDFCPLLVIDDGRGGAEIRDSKSLDKWNARIVREIAEPAHLRVRVESADDRGGEFQLSVATGRIVAPADLVERTKRVVRQYEALARRADERGDAEESLPYLDTASRASFSIGDFAAADRSAEQELQTAAATNSKEYAIRGKANLGAAVHGLGDALRAHELLDDARSQAELMLAHTTDSIAQQDWIEVLYFVCDQQSTVVAELRSPRDSLPLLRRMTELGPRARQADAAAKAWIRLGYALYTCGETSESSKAFDAAVRRLEMPNENQQLLCNAMAYSATLYHVLGMTAECQARCQKGLALACAPNVRCSLLGTLTSAYIDAGRYEEARVAATAFDELCARERIHEFGAIMEINRAAIAYRLGDFARARSLLEEALDVQERSGNHRERDKVLSNLGVVLQEMDELDAAQLCYDESLEACRANGDRREEARVFAREVDLFDRRGDMDAALAACDRVAAIADEVGDRTIAAFADGDRGWILYRMNDLDRASEFARSAARTMDEVRDSRHALEYHETLARIALRKGDARGVQDELCAAEELLEVQGVHELDMFDAAGLRSRFASWGGIAQDLAALRASSKDVSTAEKSAILRDGWQQAGRWKGRMLFEQMTSERGIRGIFDRVSMPATPAIPHVGPGSAIIEYVDGLDELRAYVVLTDGLHLVDLGARKPIEQRAERFVAAVAGASSSPKAVARLGAPLYADLIQPLLPWLPDEIKSLVVVPTPALAVLPFEALVESPAGREFDELHYLIDRFDVTYAPSSPILGEMQRRQCRKRAPKFLIIGDPIYANELAEQHSEASLDGGRLASSPESCERLRGTHVEACGIATLLLHNDPDATDSQRVELWKTTAGRNGHVNTDRFDLYVGADACSDRLRTNLSAYTTLHVAVHALIDPCDPRHSGLVLSYSPETHGMVPLVDVMRFDLDADLIVLAACDTARGRVVRGEGVHSLASAFLVAGSRSVVAGLWSIDDPNAPEMMIDFYRLQMEKRLPPAQALRCAKLALRHSHTARGSPIQPRENDGAIAVEANPYYWAPFIYIGPAE
jgi:CHAT domain-containing protein/tetratricopeptide (TPR) repeat protein